MFQKGLLFIPCAVLMLLLTSRLLPAGLPAASVTPRYAIADLGLLPHVADEVSLKINEAGQAAGWADIGGGVVHAVLWTNGRRRDLGAPPGFGCSMARGLNRRGQAAGWAVTGKSLVDSLATTHACLFSDGKCVDLGTLGGPGSQAVGINAAGQIVGVSYVHSPGSPCLSVGEGQNDRFRRAARRHVQHGL